MRPSLDVLTCQFKLQSRELRTLGQSKLNETVYKVPSFLQVTVFVYTVISCVFCKL